MSVLCGIDFSDNSRKALSRAVRLAHASEGPLVLVHSVAHADEEAIWRYFVKTPWEVPERTRRAATARLKAFFQENVATDQRPAQVQFHVALRNPSEGILDAEANSDTPFDWIVLGATGSGHVANILLGSTAEKVVRQASAPVLVVPPDAPEVPAWTSILAPVDYNAPDSDEALREAIALARDFNAHLHVLHAFSLPTQGLGLLDQQATPETLDALEQQRWHELRAYLDEFDFEGIEHSEYLRLGSPFSAISRLLEDVEGIDLICIGTRGHHGLKRMIMGSVTAKVLRTMPTEVIAFHTPTT